MQNKPYRQERFTLKKITLALLIAKPGHLQNGLQSLLRTVPQIEILAESNDPSILFKMNEEIHPELIVVDAALIGEDNWFAITKIKADWPATRPGSQGRRRRLFPSERILRNGACQAN